VGFSVGSKGYVGTGWGGVSNTDDFWEYDPITDTWTQKADLPGGARIQATGFGMGTKGYLGTGYDGTYMEDFWEYDPATDSWTQLPDLGGGARHVAVGFSIGGTGYIGTGADDLTKHDFWAYTSDVSTGIAEQGVADLTLWPNPASSSIHLSGPVDGQVLDVTGQVVKQVQQATEIAVDDLPVGTYHLHIRTGGMFTFIRQ
jgi:hypothetical protein